MSVYRTRTRTKALGTAPKPQVQALTIPASVGGVNTLTSIAGMNPTDCLWTYNLMPSELGMELRSGYREWTTNLGGDGTEEEVRFMTSYEGQQANHSDDRLFAMTTTGIYDVTLFNQDDPLIEFTWAISSDKSGFCNSTNFANDANEHFVYLADTENGLHQYTASLDSWAAVTGLTVDDGLGVQVPWGLETAVTYVMSHKLRLWLAIDDSGDAFYLPVESGAGEVFKFTFGSKFEHGGYLMGLWSWSYESTGGIEDYLVAISRAGDVLIYSGSDPSQPDWKLVGSYFIGEVTSARNIAMNYGSEMYVLSTYGLTSLTDLIKGHESYLPGASPTTKIARPIRQALFDEKESKAWGLTVNAAEGDMVIWSPYEADRPQDAIQYVQNLLTQAWGYWRGMPMMSSVYSEGGYYFGDQNGSVWIYDGVVDGTTLEGTVGLPIDFETLTAFVPGSNSAQYMQVGYIRVVSLLEGQAAVSLRAVYDYKIQDSAPLPIAISGGGGGLWDFGIWDTDVWSYNVIGADAVLGTLGWGRVVAVSTRGSSDSAILVTGWDLMYIDGGLL